MSELLINDAGTSWIGWGDPSNYDDAVANAVEDDDAAEVVEDEEEDDEALTNEDDMSVDRTAILPLPTMNWASPVGNAAMKIVTDTAGRQHNLNPEAVIECYESENGVEVFCQGGVKLHLSFDEAKRAGLGCGPGVLAENAYVENAPLIPPELFPQHPTYASFGRGDSDDVDPRATLVPPIL